MSFLNSFIHGDKLTEFLIEGHNPDARQKLLNDDVDALRQHMQTGEVLRAYVLGRVVMSGRGVWALTEKQILIRNAARQSLARIDIAHIANFEAVRGRYGHTVRILADGREHSMYGVDAALAQSMHVALASLGVASAFEDKPARGTLWAAYSEPQPSANDCLIDAKERLLAA
jgi:hypothetical protein